MEQTQLNKYDGILTCNHISFLVGHATKADINIFFHMGGSVVHPVNIIHPRFNLRPVKGQNQYRFFQNINQSMKIMNRLFVQHLQLQARYCQTEKQSRKFKMIIKQRN